MVSPDSSQLTETEGVCAPLDVGRSIAIKESEGMEVRHGVAEAQKF